MCLDLSPSNLFFLDIEFDKTELMKISEDFTRSRFEIVCELIIAAGLTETDKKG